MKDFNFFEEYIPRKKQVSLETTILVVAIFCMLIVSSSLYLSNRIKISRLNDEKEILEELIHSKQMKEEVKLNNEANNNFNETKLKYVAIEVVVSNRQTEGIITNEMIDKIKSVVPEGVSFTNMVVNEQGVQISAKGTSRESIANFQNKIKGIGIFNKVYIPAISGEKGSVYDFSIKCDISGDK